MPDKLLYVARPERKLEGIWLPCSALEARRWAVYRIKYFQKKRGSPRPRPQQRLIAVFRGDNARTCADKLVAHSMSLQKPKVRRPETLYKSLTKLEWLEAQGD